MNNPSPSRTLNAIPKITRPALDEKSKSVKIEPSAKARKGTLQHLCAGALVVFLAMVWTQVRLANALAPKLGSRAF